MKKYVNLILLAVIFFNSSILSMQNTIKTDIDSILKNELLVFNIFKQVIKNHVNKCNNIFTFEDGFNKLHSELKNLRLISKAFNDLYNKNQEIIILTINHIKNNKFNDLVRQCKAKYSDLDKDQLNKALSDILSSNNSDLEKATELVLAGADHNFQDFNTCISIEHGLGYVLGCNKNVTTLLMRLAWLCKYQLVESLVKNGANIDLQDEVGCTALVYSIQKTDIKMIKLLISLRANINISDNLNQSPLVYAVRTKNAEIVELLLKSKIDPSIRNIITGRTALDEAKASRLQSIIELIEKYSAN